MNEGMWCVVNWGQPKLVDDFQRNLTMFLIFSRGSFVGGSGLGVSGGLVAGSRSGVRRLVVSVVVLPVVLTVAVVAVGPLDLSRQWTNEWWNTCAANTINKERGRDLGAETPVLGLLVAGSVVRRIAAVVAELVFVIAGHVGVLEVAVVLLLGRIWAGSSALVAIARAIGHHGRDHSGKQQHLLFLSVQFEFILEQSELTSKLKEIIRAGTHHERRLHCAGWSKLSSGWLYRLFASSLYTASRGSPDGRCPFTILDAGCVTHTHTHTESRRRKEDVIYGFLGRSALLSLFGVLVGQVAVERRRLTIPREYSGHQHRKKKRKTGSYLSVLTGFNSCRFPGPYQASLKYVYNRE